jgi:two-component system cell cycle response regulator
MHILFVEDDPRLQRETARFLEAHQHEVTVCSNVPEGLAYAEQHEPDLLLCDYRLEGSPNGLVLAKQVRNLYKDCVIVMISAYAETDNVIEALLLDLDHYIRRPITLEALHDELWKAVDFHRQKRASRPGSCGRSAQAVPAPPAAQTDSGRQISLADCQRAGERVSLVGRRLG